MARPLLRGFFSRLHLGSWALFTVAFGFTRNSHNFTSFLFLCMINNKAVVSSAAFAWALKTFSHHIHAIILTRQQKLLPRLFLLQLGAMSQVTHARLMSKYFVYICTHGNLVTFFFGFSSQMLIRSGSAQWIRERPESSLCEVRANMPTLHVLIHGFALCQKTGFNLYNTSWLVRNSGSCCLGHGCAECRRIFF